jgi:hypothetical protein
VIAASADTFELAVSRFNASEAARRVAGLARTLGEPRISIGAAAGTADAARITVAWDLTWYQWKVAGGEREQPVAELARGTELEQLDAAARQWNARWRS